MFDDIALFVQIVQQQGLAATARQQKIPAATVTRRLQKLEQQLGCQLIHRSARQFVLTAEGEIWYQAYAELVAQMESTQRSLSLELQELSGPLRVMAPSNISNGLLQPMWSGFIRDYPAIELMLMLNNEVEDLQVNRADIALRIGEQQDSALYQKRLGSIATRLFAASNYLARNGSPDNLDALQTHRLIGARPVTQWTLHHARTGQTRQLQPHFASWSTDITFNTQLAADGLGIALLPVSETRNYEASNRLVPVLPEWQGEQRNIYAIWPSGRLLNARARCLLDYMARFIDAALTNEGNAIRQSLVDKAAQS